MAWRDYTLLYVAAHWLDKRNLEPGYCATVELYAACFVCPYSHALLRVRTVTYVVLRLATGVAETM